MKETSTPKKDKIEIVGEQEKHVRKLLPTGQAIIPKGSFLWEIDPIARTVNKAEVEKVPYIADQYKKKNLSDRMMSSPLHSDKYTPDTIGNVIRKPHCWYFVARDLKNAKRKAENHARKLREKLDPNFKNKNNK